MAISLIPKEAHQQEEQKPKISVAWFKQNILPLVAIVIFLGTSSVYGYFFSYERSLSGNSDKLQIQYDAIRKQINGEERILASNFALRASELLKIINKRNTPSRLFELLEDTTHPNVSFSLFAFSFKLGDIRLSGSAGGYNDLAEQILIWEKSPEIFSVEVSDFTTDTSGNLQFSAILILGEDAYVKS